MHTRNVSWPHFLELRIEVKVTVTQRQYATLRDLKVYPHQIWGPYLNIGYMLTDAWTNGRLKN